MKRISNSIHYRTSNRQSQLIADGINEIMDYLEKDMEKKIKEMVVKEINNRFEILDL